MRSKATVEKTQMLLYILKDVLLTVKLDNCDRFRQMVLEEKARHEQLVDSTADALVSLDQLEKR